MDKVSPLARFPLPNESALETVGILKRLTQAHRFLAELKGVAKTIPNEGILISTLTLQEAKDSSAVENIITSHDELFQVGLFKGRKISQAAKEVQDYHQALLEGHRRMHLSGLIRYQDILHIQSIIEPSRAGIRKVPGTVVGNAHTGAVIYTPPQHSDEISALLDNLVQYINDDRLSSLDPIIKMALIHHQFESIHPFYDGNGRTGRILNILYLGKYGLLDLPVLYLSRYIVGTNTEYYQLLQAVRETGDWEHWVAYVIKGVEITAREAIHFIDQIRALVSDTKQRMRTELPKIYSQDLLNNLFFHPYTKVGFVIDQLGVTRITATKYLNRLAQQGFVNKRKIGRTNYYINEPLVRLIVEQDELR